MNMKILIGVLVGIVLVCFITGFLSLKHYNYQLSSICGLNLGSKGISIDADGAHVGIGAGGIHVQEGKNSVKIGPGGIDILDGDSNKSFKIGPKLSWGFFESPFNTKNLVEKNIDEETSEYIDGIEYINIATSFIDIDIIPYEEDDIKIHYNGYIKASSIPELKVDRSEDTLYIYTDADKPFNAFDSDITLDIYIPSTFKEHLDVSTASGDIEIRNIEIDSLKANSSSGDIDILGSSANSIWINSASGDQIVENSTYSEGNFGSSSGDIVLILPEDSEFNLKARTSSGDIYSDFPLTITTKDRFALEGIVGDGTNTIDISTSSGDISIKSR